MVLLRLEIVNDYWVVERSPVYDDNDVNEYLYKRKGYWDAYNLLRASPVIYWEQPLSFEQFANNIWANGFVALLDAPTGIGPKQRAEFIFAPPYIPDNCVVSCRIAYNATGILFRFPDIANPNSMRQIRVMGSTYDHPNGSVIFSIIHSHPMREDFYTWNWSSCVTPANNNYAYSTPSYPPLTLTSVICNSSFVKSSTALYEKVNTGLISIGVLKEKSNKAYYDLDFRLDSKYTTQIYPLIIHPLNRFHDIDSYYMAELSDICIQSQGFSDIKNNLQMAEQCYKRMFRLFKTYPFIIQLCLWLKTPTKLKQQKVHRKSAKASRRLKHSSSYHQDSVYNSNASFNYNQDRLSMACQDYYSSSNPNHSVMRYNSMNEPNDFNPRNDSLVNPLRMSQAPFYNFNRGESIMYDDNFSSDYINNNMLYDKSLAFNDEDFYDYQKKRIEIMKMKFVLEKLATLIQYLQYSSPFLFMVLLLHIYRKKAREWMVLIKCAYQLVTYQLKDPYVIVTSPKKKRISRRRH